MNFTEAEELSALRQTVRRFIARECPPAEVRRWDREDTIPRAMLVKLAALGICGLYVPEEYGGLGRKAVAMAVVLEELARCSLALAGIYNFCACYGGVNLTHKGTEEQKRRLLPKVVSGELVLSYGLSEPDVGADLADVKTRAERRGDRVVINGAKRWTSGAVYSDYIYALVRSGPPEARRQNLSFVLIPTSAPGVTITHLPTMGSRGTPTADVRLENVEVPFEDVIGGEEGWNNGWSMLAGPALEIEKLVPTAIAVGIAEAAVAEAWDYSQQRVQGGKHICAHQAVRHVLADVQTKLLTCRLMLMNAAGLVESGGESALATSMAKLYIAETARSIVLDCQQYVMGAYGYAEGFNMERHVRDILGAAIYGGSSAIQKNNIANLMRLPRS